MSLVLAVLYESNWLREDGAKLFFFGACFTALLVLARLASRNSTSSYTPPTPASEQSDFESAEPSQVAGNEPCSQKQAAEDPDSLPPVRSVSFALRTIRFKSFEIGEGPPDLESFCDDVSISLNYKGGSMPWDFTVATPKALAAKIDANKWRSAFLRQVLVVPYWDAEMITADLLHRIKTELESVPDEVAEDEMKEADRSS